MIRVPLLLLSAALTATLTTGVAGPSGSAAPCCTTVHETKTRITHLDSPVTTRQHARVRVTVTSDDADYVPVGEINLKVDGKSVGSKLLRGHRDDGTRVFTLDRLSPGVHLVKASFGGNLDATASQSGSVRLRVTR